MHSPGTPASRSGHGRRRRRLRGSPVAHPAPEPLDRAGATTRKVPEAEGYLEREDHQAQRRSGGRSHVRVEAEAVTVVDERTDQALEEVVGEGRAPDRPKTALEPGQASGQSNPPASADRPG